LPPSGIFGAGPFFLGLVPARPSLHALYTVLRDNCFLPSRPKALLSLWHIAPTGSAVFAAMRFVASLKALLYQLLYSTFARFDWSLNSLACLDKRRVRFIDCDALIMVVLVEEESVEAIVTGDMSEVLTLSAVISMTMLPSLSFLSSSCQDLLI
jgi:hypothetical protein